jgi:hypothetical protein
MDHFEAQQRVWHADSIAACDAILDHDAQHWIERAAKYEEAGYSRLAAQARSLYMMDPDRRAKALVRMEG